MWWYWPWESLGKRFAALKTLTKIYVCASAFVAGLAAMFALHGRLPFLLPAVAFAVVALAAPIERLFLRLAARKRAADGSDHPSK